jgi:hypothetical protein
MFKRCVCVIGLAWILGGCALEPLKYDTVSAPPSNLGIVCVKTDYWSPCKPMRVERLRTDGQWRMLLGESL